MSRPVPSRTLVAPGPGLRRRLLAAAFGYAERGMHVFPVCVGRKKPPLWRDWEHRATADPDIIRSVWGRAPYNVGVACGPSGLVVVDLDTPEAAPGADPDLVSRAAAGDPAAFAELCRQPDRWREAGVRDGVGVLAALARRAGQPWPTTMTVHTATPGRRHLLYRAPDGVDLRNSARTVDWCIDVRARGGYVVGIGSEVDGRAYRLDPGAPATPAEMPGWLLALVRRPGKPTIGGASAGGPGRAARLRPPAGGGGDRWAQAALAGQAADVAAMPPDSGRNNALNAAAYKLGRLAAGGRLDPDDVARVLTDAGTACGLGGAEAARTVASGLAAGMRNPRTRAGA
jgi:hypothetical protein